LAGCPEDGLRSAAGVVGRGCVQVLSGRGLYPRGCERGMEIGWHCYSKCVRTCKRDKFGGRIKKVHYINIHTFLVFKKQKRRIRQYMTDIQV